MAAGVTPQGRVAPISERLGALQGDAWNLYGNGGMQSTVEDMHRWYRALSGATPPFDPELRALLIQPRARRDSVIAYGMGWYIRTNAAGEVEQVSHTGGDGVFFAAFVWRPLERSFFYLVTNTQGMGADLASELLRTLRSAAGGG
jgi:CubicO group peptidase (beta-lactamase class C family)